jgi:hypothetical protein
MKPMAMMIFARGKELSTHHLHQGQINSRGTSSWQKSIFHANARSAAVQRWSASIPLYMSARSVDLFTMTFQKMHRQLCGQSCLAILIPCHIGSLFVIRADSSQIISSLP